MTEESTVATDPRESLNLKLDEPEVSSDDPWGDDVLNRAQIARRLTNLIRTQSMPLIVSIDGYWGTGKTFMLKRWQQDLENQDFRAIYFNAWEDDFCDDPLLAIIGQLSEYFQEDDDLGGKARRAFETAMPLLRQNAMSIGTSLLERHIGVSGLTLQVKQEGKNNENLLQEYRNQRATKTNLKDQLTELSNDVMADTGHPLVFIIDELDRCRPTFAVELLERVKHIFEVHNLVFVFGINRKELCKSLQSIYGEIDADVYLRRFFDMEFVLPVADSLAYCQHLFRKLEFYEVFGAILQHPSFRKGAHIGDFPHFLDGIPMLWVRLGMSLRDIDYCARLISLVGKNVRNRREFFPWLLGLLIPLKLQNPTLYLQLIGGHCLSSDVMNYINSEAGMEETEWLDNILSILEANLYIIESQADPPLIPGSTALAQFELLKNGEELTHPRYLSERTREADQRKLEMLDDFIESSRVRSKDTISYLATLIDLHLELTGR